MTIGIHLVDGPLRGHRDYPGHPMGPPLVLRLPIPEEWSPAPQVQTDVVYAVYRLVPDGDRRHPQYRYDPGTDSVPN